MKQQIDRNKKRMHTELLSSFFFECIESHNMQFG